MRAFASTRLLTRLNAVSMPCSLAALTTHGLRWMQPPSWAVAVPTLLAAYLWLRLFRSGRALHKVFILAVPIAAGNAALSAALTFADFGNSRLEQAAGRFVGGLIMGPLAGVLVWLPALLLVLLFYGLPLSRARRLSERGLSGSERGELMVGLISALLTLPIWLWPGSGGGHGGYEPLTCVLAGAAVCAGVAASILASERGVRRREFVRKVSAGEVAGFRVEDTEQGTALVRIVDNGQGYRVADFHEELCTLDAEGEVRELRSLSRSTDFNRS